MCLVTILKDTDNTEILIGQCPYISMSNSLSFLREVILDYDEFSILSVRIKSEPDKFDQEFVLESINFFERHKHDTDLRV
jgi:hypothetical protein